jgi:chaperonin GroES
MELNITRLLESTNITDQIDEEKLVEIGSQVVKDYQTDERSRADWVKRSEEWIKLATQVIEDKSHPWTNAANVKFPLVTTSAMQFSARAYPALVQGLDVVKIRTIGEDPQGEKAARAARIAKHMSYQILEQMEDWEEDMDKITMIVPIVGCAFKKTWYDPSIKRNRSELVHAKDLVVNYYAKSLETASRKTHILYKTANEIKEKQLKGIYREVELQKPEANNPHNNPELDKVQGKTPPQEDSSAPYVLLEQHRLWDLDGDGYEEPYIITVEEASEQVLRIVARFEEDSVERQGDKIVRIEPTEYFTMFPFIPNPDGGFYPLGFGALLGPINETVNTLINQLLDAGTLSNLQGGFLSKGLRLKAGNVRFDPGEWKIVNAGGDDLKKGIVPLPAKDPSPVLFQLLGTIVQSGKELASVAEIFVGKMPGQNTPATTTMATIEQGMKVFTAIYKRLFRALKKEYKKLYRLNSLYLDDKEYFTILDSGQQEQVSANDYKGDIGDIAPNADPTAVSEIQKLAKAQGLIELLQIGTLNPLEVTKRVLEAQQQENIQALINTQPQPDPKVQEMQMKMQMEQQKMQAKMQADQQKHQMEMQAKQMELQLKELEMKMDLQMKRMETQGLKVKHEMDMEMKEEQHFMKMSQQEEQFEQKKKQAKEMPKKPNGKANGGRNSGVATKQSN